MRIFILAACAATAIAAAEPASAQTLQRSEAVCAIAAVPADARAEFRRTYAAGARAAFDGLFTRAVATRLVACIAAASPGAAAQTRDRPGYVIANFLSSHEVMNASAGWIASTDAETGASLDAAYRRLTPAQLATLVVAAGSDDATGADATRAFLSMVSPAMTDERRQQHPRLAHELWLYVTSRATYESILGRP